MIITDSSLNLASQHLAIKQYQKKQSLKVWFGAQRPDFEGAAKRRAISWALRGKEPRPSHRRARASGRAIAIPHI